MRKDETIRRIQDFRLLLVLDGGEMLLTVGAAVAAGVGAVEAPMSEDMAQVRALLAEYPDLVCGVGGVATTAQAWAAVEAGAGFVAASPLDAEIAAICEAADVATVACAGDETALLATLGLRPGMVRLPPPLPAPGPEYPPLIVRLPTADARAAQQALASGAAAVAISLTSLGAGSASDQQQHLQMLVASLRPA